jgi:hypothetical protein
MNSFKEKRKMCTIMCEHKRMLLIQIQKIDKEKFHTFKNEKFQQKVPTLWFLSETFETCRVIIVPLTLYS